LITRVLDAPRGVVWRSWTSAQHLKRWWGPKDFTAPKYEMAVHPEEDTSGVCSRLTARNSGSEGEFREVVPLKKLVMTDSFADNKGNAVPASFYGIGYTWPMKMLISVSFYDFDGRRKTRVILRHSGLKNFTSKDISELKQGWTESLDKLENEVKCEY